MTFLTIAYIFGLSCGIVRGYSVASNSGYYQPSEGYESPPPQYGAPAPSPPQYEPAEPSQYGPLLPAQSPPRYGPSSSGPAPYNNEHYPKGPYSNPYDLSPPVFQSPSVPDQHGQPVEEPNQMFYAPTNQDAVYNNYGASPQQLGNYQPISTLYGSPDSGPDSYGLSHEPDHDPEGDGDQFAQQLW